MAIGTMSVFMDQLVAGARSSRDSAFNTLDAIERQTRSASSHLAQRVEQFIAENPAPEKVAAPSDGSDQPTPRLERDARFDPQDEWAVPGPDRATQPSPDPPARGVSDDDDDDYPQTWLR